ncbi:MAG TPA: hypothetical protein VFI27_12820 [candidate division Zixibacteria bacterium]|nr:hypothetical protein [candidate division Zixibacteria bacterium]
MYTFLILPLALLLGGAIASLLLARYRPRFSADTAGISAVFALIVWLLAFRDLPLVVSEDINQPPSGGTMWRLAVDESAWLVSFAVLILLTASLLIMISANRYFQGEGWSSLRRRSTPSACLLLAVGVLLSIWTVSLPAVATSWTLIAGSWVLLEWAARKDRHDSRETITRTGVMLLSLLFLGLAMASQPSLTDLVRGPESLSASARVWSMLAAIAMLGAFPLNWWRPVKGRFVPGSVALVNLAPSAAGAFLLSRLASNGVDGGNTYTLLLTVFGLLGLIYSIGISWSNLDKSRVVLGAIVMALTSLILLAGAWSNATTVSMMNQVLVLGAGVIYLGVNWQGRLSTLYKLPVWIGVAAIAGIPLTAGFLGLSSLYQGQISESQLILAIVTAVAMMPVLAASLLLVREASNDGEPLELSRTGQARLLFAFSLPALGLILLPGSLDVGGDLINWILILVSILGALAISWYAIKASDFTDAISGAFHLKIPLQKGIQILNPIATATGAFIREAAAILEGEGGMLWLLLLAVILWLARVV